jgi:hypothetical protein
VRVRFWFCSNSPAEPARINQNQTPRTSTAIGTRNARDNFQSPSTDTAFLNRLRIIGEVDTTTELAAGDLREFLLAMHLVEERQNLEITLPGVGHEVNGELCSGGDRLAASQLWVRTHSGPKELLQISSDSAAGNFTADAGSHTL